jgi:HD-GYP domain-containing protein (c-di-GMP phosphodiesterase class II)
VPTEPETNVVIAPTRPDNTASTGIRLAEVMAALSTATDLAMGQPLEFAMASCVVAVRLGDALGYDDRQLRAIYYQALLRYIGCNAETTTMAALAGDELFIRTEFATLDTADKAGVMKLMVRSIRTAHEGEPALAVARHIVRGLATIPGMTKEFFTSHCEVAQQLATRLGFEPEIVAGLGQLYERWDGKGMPRGLKGEEVVPAVRVVTLVQDAITFHRLSGQEAAVAVVRERRGAAYDPAIADRFCETAAHLMADIDDLDRWERVLAMEPGKQIALSGDELDVACGAMADFADIKAPFTVGHSHRVGELAVAAAAVARLPARDAAALGRAACLHDIGRSGVSAAIWSKPGPLAEREWDLVRLYPYHTARILRRPAGLKPVAEIAASHRERLDGSGYHRGLSQSALNAQSRLLAIADAYCAMTEDRPHRPARSPDYAASQLRQDAAAGAFDPELTEAVLVAAGHARKHSAAEPPAGLSSREIEVLRLLARGKRKREIAQELFLAEKTVDNHVQHIYEKIGVTTRAAAAVFAVERGLLT